MNKLPAALLAAALAACAAPIRSDVPGPPSPAPGFALRDLSGAPVSLADFRGKTVLLDFWAAWCEPCNQSIPLHVAMQDRLRSKGFVVLGVDEDEQAATAAAYARVHGVNYRILRDPGTALFKEYRGRDLPSCFLIDARGNVRGRWDGFDAATGVDVERATDALLDATPSWRNWLPRWLR